MQTLKYEYYVSLRYNVSRQNPKTMKNQKQNPDATLTQLQFPGLAFLKRVSAEYSHFGQDYMLSHVTTNASLFYSDRFMRFDGFTLILCTKGILTINLNLETIVVQPQSIIFIGPDQVFQPLEWQGEEHEAYILFLSHKYMADINIDLNSVNTNIFTSAKAVLQIKPENVQFLILYFEMLHNVSLGNNRYARHIARSLTSAASYQIMAFSEELSKTPTDKQPQSRKMTYVQTFLRLVRNHHRRERAIGFYADKMFISPKYLSLIIKDATGRSAAEWIDQYVIQEAKNLLRYSGKNVQQVAYELNFTNQSSFGKYFKHLTGLSPTQFQNQ